jgi:Cu/Ag efflux protein CusF
MKTLGIVLTILVATLILLFSAGAMAQESIPGANLQSIDSAAELTDGEVRKVDRDNKKITIKHGEIRNLDMPGMTMVFRVSDPALLDRVNAGDKVRFRAEKTGGSFVVTDIQRIQ